MKKLIILTLSIVALLTSCQQRPQVFGVYIDGTFDQFMEDLDKEHMEMLDTMMLLNIVTIVIG